MDEKLRGTGRTTQILYRVLGCCGKPAPGVRRIAVIAHNETFAQTIKLKAFQIAVASEFDCRHPPRSLTIEVGKCVIDFYGRESWERRSVEGRANHYHRVFWDHYAIEEADRQWK